MPTVAGKYQGGFQLPTDDTLSPQATSVDKILKAIALLTSVRTDEIQREEEVDAFLAFTVEGLTKIAEGESMAGVLSKADIATQQPQQGYMHSMSAVPGLYRRAGRVGG